MFSRKPFWQSTIEEPSHALNIPPIYLDPLLEVFNMMAVKSFGSCHVHTYARSRHGDALIIHAPSTAFLAKGATDLPALEQLGVVEYICEDGMVDAYFRSIPALVEGDPGDVPEFNAHLVELGITLDA